MSTASVQAASPPLHSDWSPLRNKVFLGLWLASSVSYIGFEIRNYAAPLLMMDFGASVAMTTGTQTASFLPIFLLVLVAGALADVLDRRILLIVTHVWMMLAAGMLGLLTLAGLMTPWLLLAFLLLIGAGFAMMNPVFLAVLPELVEPGELRSALALNSVALNVARVLGPAVGGLIVFLVGKGPHSKGAAFLATAVSVLGVIIVVWRWQPAVRQRPTNPESVASAIRTGFRYARYSPRLRAILLRIFLFIFFAGVLPTFAAVIGKKILHKGDGGVAIMMVSLGVGAIVGVYYMQALQRRIGIEQGVALCTALYGGAMLGVAAAPSLPLACVAMCIAGFNWVIVPTNFNIATQLAVPAWVKGRAMGMYVLVLYGSLAAGPAVFGKLADSIGPRLALACAAFGVLVSMIAIVRFRLVPRGKEDFTLSKHWPKPLVAGEPDAEHGPVMVNIEYHIDPHRAADFSAVMHELRLQRLRAGSYQWGLYDAAATPGRYIETFLVRSWAEHLRQHERMTRADAAIEARALSFHLASEPPAVSHWVHARPPVVEPEGGGGYAAWVARAERLLERMPGLRGRLAAWRRRFRAAWQMHLERSRDRDFMSTKQTAPWEQTPLRPPATPLITHDPYFSVWSAADRLTDAPTTHWTGKRMTTCGLVRIDAKTYRFMGNVPADLPAMEQRRLDVLPTRTIYEFDAGGVRLSVTFLSPLLPHDLEILARPVTYVTWSARSTDGKPHAVRLYLDVTGEWAVDKPEQMVLWSREKSPELGGLTALRIGSQSQPVLAKTGDDVRIDWGYLYQAIPTGPGVKSIAAAADDARAAFVAKGNLPEQDDPRMPRAANDQWPALACTLDLGRIGAEPVWRHVLLAYDDLFSIEYFNHQCRPWWRRNGMELPQLLAQAEQDYPALTKRCETFDAELMSDLEQAGGHHYARLCALAFRQCIAAHKLAAGPDGAPLWMSKENFSNGCMNTVDVTYPSAPFFLLFNPALLKAQTTPVLDYAASSRWKHAYAPHDMGVYPKANGQVYGGGEETDLDQMPVEECGNMLLLAAAIVHADGNADYAIQHWGVLAKWAEYLRDKGLDPENQLCTDDFAGHLAHNANLSLKAILALGGFSQVCQTAGKKEEAKEYRALAQEMATRWQRLADDGDHYRLAFDRPGSWSQKYNLVWDKLLGMNLFPPAVAQREIAFYKTKINPFGLPLDDRKTYAKLDWSVWTATMADSRQDFESLVNPLYAFADQSPSRVPLTDFYQTTDGKQMYFQARSVVGGIYIKLLADPKMRAKWGSPLVEHEKHRSQD